MEITPAGGHVRAAGPDRSALLDVARALVVVLVVLNHSLDGLVAAGLLDRDGPAAAVNHVLYLFRMPALAFLLGLLVPGSVRRAGAGPYLRRRTVTVLWLYLVWSVLQGLVELATNGLRNGHRSPWTLLALWDPQAHLWFLPFLAVATALVVVLRPWRRERTVAVVAGLAVLSLIAWGWTPPVIGLRGLSLVLFVALGSLVGVAGARRWSEMRGPVVAAVAGAALVVLVLVAGDAVPSTLPSAVDLADRVRGLVAAVAGTAVVGGAAWGLSRCAGVAEVLAAVGRRTLPVYLMHVMVVAGVRIVLVRLGVDQPALVLLVAVALGVLLPVLAARWAPRLGLGWLFSAPRPVRARVSRAG